MSGLKWEKVAAERRVKKYGAEDVREGGSGGPTRRTARRLSACWPSSRRGCHQWKSLCWGALESVPRLPAYARRALERLKHEMTTALEQEAMYRSALSDVKTTVQDVDPWDNAPSL